MMICQGTHFVLATCLAVVGVEKVNVLSFAFALRWLQEATVNLISTLASSSVLQDNACRLTCINRLKTRSYPKEQHSSQVVAQVCLLLMSLCSWYSARTGLVEFST
ncbi:uncharacterized protein LOC114399410 isoform X2 [Glycine soja]|uniref:uncharacterized protein LOC114399410 isoform X2 n=1 Tax=Glycine soja TaxID=3848 RepID=UPI000E21BDD3|nr:uncharacterized protein LOC114399410 isoform X2 [Glycine soja]|eukprot:XP_025982875.1 uncharacterized protein LOC106797437 isoform X2 [Glycine max]